MDHTGPGEWTVIYVVTEASDTEWRDRVGLWSGFCLALWVAELGYRGERSSWSMVWLMFGVVGCRTRIQGGEVGLVYRLLWCRR